MNDPFHLPVPLPQADPPSEAPVAGQLTESHQQSLPPILTTQENWRRQHISAIFLGMLGLGRSIFNFIPAIAALGLTDNAHYIPLAIAAFLLFSLANVVIKWFTTLYRVEPDSLSLREGFLGRNERQISFDRVQDISIEQGFLSRLLGVARISIETGAGSGEDVSLDPITMAKAQELREILRLYRQQIPTAEPARDLSDAAENAAQQNGAAHAQPLLDNVPSSRAAADNYLLFSLTKKNLLLSGLFSPSFAIIALFFAILGFADRFEDFGITIPDEREMVDIASGYFGQQWLQQTANMATLFWLISAAVVALATLSIITGLLRTIFRDWDYRLRREARTLRRSRGLTTRTDVAITIRRIQSATLVTGLIRQIFGWQELRLRSLASDIGSGEGGGDHQAISFARREDINPVLQEIDLLPNWSDINWRRSHAILALPSPVAILLLIGAGVNFWLAAPPLWCWGPLAAGLGLAALKILKARRYFHAVDGDKILIRSGFLRPALTILPIRAIQSADIRDNFIYRRFGLATLAFGVPGISSIADDRIAAIPLRKAHHLRAAILHRGESL